jgi:murein DD-endopeptidase MepM/ murein hydrolase activator NlpD
MTLNRKLLLLLPFTLLTSLVVGFLLPEKIVMPVTGATVNDWNKDTFWYEPWGSSGVHKGIDIFANKGTDLVSTTAGIIVFEGDLSKGGKVVIVLGPKWRLHYYAHLESIVIDRFEFVSANQKIGTVGDTGNAKGKPPHVHYSIVTLLPYFWKITTESQGWKKMFFLDPGAFII